MSRILTNIDIELDESIEEKLQWLAPGYSSYRILRQSVDARRSRKAHFVYTIEVFEAGEVPQAQKFELTKVSYQGPKPVIVGSGPAGLFAALRFIEVGIPCVLLERGSEAEKRMLKINRFWRYGDLDLNDNVCFGEGGAGLYSDGKLITRIKSPHIPYVLHKLVEFGAPEEILYLANPHVGSDRIRRVIPRLRAYLLKNGCEIHFNTQVTNLAFDSSRRVQQVICANGKSFNTDHVVLATGHSAVDVLTMLAQHEVKLQGKPYALGLRIEHPQELINQAQYRDSYTHPKLGAANYKLTHHNSQTQVGVYSFCMCPGGYVLSAGTDANALVCNGMSNYNRNSPFANSAIVVTIDHDKRFGSHDIFAGLNFRAQIEQAAYQAVQQAHGTRQLPAQKVTDFMEGKLTGSLPSSSPSGVLATRLDQILPHDIVENLRSGLTEFSKKLKGFVSPTAQLHGVETRTSCPLRVTRDSESLESLSHPGLYPTGEGAGYAGGITSAACDGIRVAEAIISQIKST